MRRNLLVALALGAVAAPFVSDAPALTPRLPTAAVIVNDACFGGGGEGANTLGASKGNGGAPAKKAPTATKTPTAAKPPVVTRQLDAGDAPDDVAAATPTGGAPEFEAEESPAQGADGKEWRAERARPEQVPAFDWGATVYLSNDDSMSLASAQRVLWAVMNDAHLDVRQIRPHELLNYFSFDTVTPDADETFDVLASAEQNGDQLSLAVAVKGATPTPRPLDLTWVVDRSGSMSAEGRMEYVHRAMNLAVDQLRAGDRVDIVVFDHGVCTPLQNFVVGRDDEAVLRRVIGKIQPEGSTDIGIGLKEGYRVARARSDTHGRNRRMMLVTDALINTGDIDPNTVSEIAKAYESDGIRVTGVGVGTDFDDRVLDLLTEKGKGAYVYLGSDAVVDRLFGPAGFPSLVNTIAHDVHFALNLPDSLAMERFYGEESSTVKDEVQPIHYYAGTSQVFLQDLALRDGRLVPSDPVELVIEYRDAATGEPETRVFRTTVGQMLKADPHNVDKARSLMAWSDVLTEQAMGGDPCGAPLRTYAERAARLGDDAEIAFVNGLVRKQCGEFDLPSVVRDHGVPFKVKVDSDVQLASAALECGGARWTDTISTSDHVATFADAPAGEVCDLVLGGVVDLRAEVTVPSVGGDLRCVIRGGRISCG